MSETGDMARSSERAALPTGTVTFLFTDVEGSTQRWETHRSAMPAAVKRHDELLRSFIESNGGFVFKTIGDAFCGVFDEVASAINAALDIQRALAKEDFSAVGGLGVRIALHTGTCDERNGDYFGPTVNRVARLLSVGHGGQILLSDATSALAKVDLPTRVSLRDLGGHRLKDLSNPEHVHQLVAADLPAEFPALRSLDAISNNLPIQVTSFRGREEEMNEVSRALEATRLVTLFGAGGVGKTRLALQVAAEVLDRFPDGVWYLELASTADPDFVPSVIAGLLNAPENPERSATDTLLNFLKRKRMLLIFDNCEHVIDEASKLAAAILHNCPDVRILATSRQAFNIAGEDVVRVASLGAPDTAKAVSAQDALRFGAVALFVDRATSVNRSFRLTDDMAPIVADICRRLDGIPLAIELAAARVKVLSIPHLAQRLSERFRILSSGDRTALKRQQTMRALIDWSYDLLTDPEKQIFRRLAIFSGDFSLDAVSDVCAGGDIDSLDILDLISSLVDKSLVVAETGGSIERYRLLESTREYGLEKLSESGERDQLAQRHAQYYLKLAREGDAAFPNEQRTTWLPRMKAELDNFRGVLDWALVKKQDVALGAELAALASLVWWDAGFDPEGRRWVQAALAFEPQLSEPVRAKAWLALAPLTAGKESYEASTHAMQLFEQLGDRKAAALAKIQHGFALFQIGRGSEGVQPVTEAVSTLRSEAGPRSLAIALTIMGLILWIEGDVDAGRRGYSEAINLAKASGDDRRVAIVLQNLAELECRAGNIGRAIELVEESKPFYVRAHDDLGLAQLSNNLAQYYVLQERYAEALTVVRWSARYVHEVDLPYHAAVGLQTLALLLAVNGDARTSSRILGFVDQAYQQLGVQREPTEAMILERLLERLQADLSEADVTTLRAEGSTLTEEQALDTALAS